MSSKKKYLALGEMIGLRADKALALDSDISSRSRAAHLIDLEHIKINGKAIKLSYLIKENDEIEIHFPPVMPQELVPLDLKLDVLFEDSDLIVINKPSGLVVHPAAGHENDTLVNALLSHTQDLSMKFNEARPGIVHRLDKETSGILVVAKNDSAHEKLALQFQERTVHRIYHAIVMGTPRQKAGRICSFLARHPNDRKRYASVLGRDRKPIQDINAPPEHGKWAATNFEVLSSNSNFSYLKLKLETGRTHQIRVHLSELSHPIVGDTLYGADKKIKNIRSQEIQKEVRSLERFLLHACELGFTHPRTGESLHFKTDWPSADLSLIQKWGLAQ